MMEESLVDSSKSVSDTEEKKDVVAYESFRKSVEAEKKARARAQELEAQLESFKTRELEEKEQFKTLADQFKEKFQQTQEELRKERERYQWEKVTGSIKTKALEHGCVNPDKLIKLFDQPDFELLRAENGQIREDSLSNLIDKAKKENPFMFSQGKININDRLPGGSAETTKIDLSKMSSKELEEYAIKQFGKK
jgi:hypothetical protein